MENKKHIINILMISGILLLFIIFLFQPDCLFKTVFKIPCSICGMTRAFKLLFVGDILGAIKMNLLCIPLLIGVLVFLVLYLINLFLRKDYIFKFYDLIVNKYKIILIILLINWVINIVKFLYY